MFELRPVQTMALDMMRASIRSGKRRPQLQLPTGTGKTVIAAHMTAGAREKKNRVAFTAPLLSLIDQTVDKFVENGLDVREIGVMQGDHPLHRLHAPIQVCSVQTIESRGFPEVDFVIVDESHLQHKTIYRWMDEKPDMVFVGLSATPWAKGMADHYDDLLVPSTIGEMIKAGDLCPFKAFAPTKPDLTGVHIVHGDYHEGELSERMGQKAIVADVVKTWLDRANGLRTIVFAVDRAHAGKLADEFRDMGVPTAYVDANTTREERNAIRGLFHRDEVKVVCSIGTMTHGVDWDVRCVSFARPTKSEMLYVQAIGRGLRTAPGKDHLLILDHSNATLDLGLVTDINISELRHGKLRDGESKAKPKQPQPRECPKCGEIVSPFERQCSCGHVFRFVSRVKTLDGDLEEIGGTRQERLNREWTWEQKHVFYGELIFYGQSRGFKEGWAPNQYRERFGRWPNAHRDAEPTPPSYATLSWIKSRQIAYAKAREAENKRINQDQRGVN